MPQVRHDALAVFAGVIHLVERKHGSDARAAQIEAARS
jgi:hypothetical protein